MRYQFKHPLFLRVIILIALSDASFAAQLFSDTYQVFTSELNIADKELQIQLYAEYSRQNFTVDNQSATSLRLVSYQGFVALFPPGSMGEVPCQSNVVGEVSFLVAADEIPWLQMPLCGDLLVVRDGGRYEMEF
ncbi:hypothetical protein P886_0947 [Alteromonadaceae bacterium 2753L.S.0a.02]|nr:hypothetical protein P886_0947 [Alteromonadaceae bacterium 2753L.S.0a.02]